MAPTTVLSNQGIKSIGCGHLLTQTQRVSLLNAHTNIYIYIILLSELQEDIIIVVIKTRSASLFNDLRSFGALKHITCLILLNQMLHFAHNNISPFPHPQDPIICTHKKVLHLQNTFLKTLFILIKNNSGLS